MLNQKRIFRGALTNVNLTDICILPRGLSWRKLRLHLFFISVLVNTVVFLIFFNTPYIHCIFEGCKCDSFKRKRRKQLLLLNLWREINTDKFRAGIPQVVWPFLKPFSGNSCHNNSAWLYWILLFFWTSSVRDLLSWQLSMQLYPRLCPGEEGRPFRYRSMVSCRCHRHRASEKVCTSIEKWNHHSLLFH